LIIDKQLAALAFVEFFKIYIPKMESINIELFSLGPRFFLILSKYKNLFHSLSYLLKRLLFFGGLKRKKILKMRWCEYYNYYLKVKDSKFSNTIYLSFFLQFKKGGFEGGVRKLVLKIFIKEKHRKLGLKMINFASFNIAFSSKGNYSIVCILV